MTALRPDSRIYRTGRHPVLAVKTDRFTARPMVDVAGLEKMMKVGPPEHGPGEQAFGTIDNAAETLGLDVARTQLAKRIMHSHVDNGTALMDVAGEARKGGIDEHAIPELLRRAAELRYREEYIAKAGPKGGRGLPDGTVREWKGGRYEKRGGEWHELAQTERGPSGTTRAATPANDKGRKGGQAPGKGTTAGTQPKPANGRPGADKPQAKQPAGEMKAPAGKKKGGNADEPDSSVAERFSRIRDQARKHGLRVGGKVRGGHSHEHMDELERRIKGHVGEAWQHTSQGASQASESAPAAESTPQASAGQAEAGNGEAAPSGTSRPTGEAAPGGGGATAPAAAAPPEPFKRDEKGRALGHDKPAAPHEAHRLKQEVADLRGQLEQVWSRLEGKHHREMYHELARDAASVRDNPSAQAVDWLSARIKSFLALVTGAAIGGLVGGPVGAAVGAAAAHKLVKSNVFFDSRGRLLVKAGESIVNPSIKPPAGFAPIPKGEHGGYRKLTAGKYEYWYPSAHHAAAAAARHDREGKASREVLRAAPSMQRIYGPSAEAHEEAARGARAYAAEHGTVAGTVKPAVPVAAPTREPEPKRPPAGYETHTESDLDAYPNGTVLVRPRKKGERYDVMARKRNGNWDISWERQDSGREAFAAGRTRGIDEQKPSRGIIALDGAQWKAYSAESAAPKETPKPVEPEKPKTEPKPPKAGGLPDATMEWLASWTMGERGQAEKDPIKGMANALNRLTPEHEKELRKFRPSEPVTVYRWTEDDDATEAKKPMRSFTHERGFVEFAEEEAKQSGRKGRILTETIHPDRILVDTTRLPAHQREDLVDEVMVYGTRKPQAGPGSEPAPKRPPPPVPAIPTKSRSPTGGFSHDVNEHGHKDNLTPGMTLKLPERHAHRGAGEVRVLADGKFEFDGAEYASPYAMLTAVHGGNREHHMTVRRYFRLGGEHSEKKLTKALSDLRTALRKHEILVQPTDDGYLRLTGALAKAGLPAFTLSSAHATVAVIDEHEANDILTALRG